MNTVRRPAVSGLFYPGDPAELAATIDDMLRAVPATDETAPPLALIAPHAGYLYSGPVAATAYARLRGWADAVTRVVVVGPAHRVPVSGLALSSATGFATPLGVIPLDGCAATTLLERPGVYIDDRAHAPEHSIEVHLPFLQRVLGEGWTLVPVIAGAGAGPAGAGPTGPAGAPGPETTALLADALDTLWGTAGTLFVISTDLSHYHDALTARRLDRATAHTIVAGEWERLDSDDACGAVPVRCALELARRHDAHVKLLDLRTSGDTAGPPDRVVGYGSFVVR